jgi:hypothetical protein
MLLLYSATIFLGAFLLFLVEPMFARMALPLLGGSPAVWNTALVFYQAVLLAGYAYAHGATARLEVRRQAGLHLALMLAPLAVLPIVVPHGWTPPVDRNPIPWLLTLLLVAVGLPFFIVSTSSVLLQKWFARTDHPAARDPYFLYAASNWGSMLALIAYPTLVEPNLGLAQQSRLWAVGYGGLVALTLACAVALWRSRAPSGNVESGAGGLESGTPAQGELETAAEELDAAVERRPEAAISVGRRVRWVLLAFVPSSLMLGVTAYLSTDIAAIPLMWVGPLALYLLTFTLVFARRPPFPEWLPSRLAPIVIIPLVMLLGMRASEPIQAVVPMHLAAFFAAALACHAELARDRPPAARLTEFYLWMSFGGMLGGLFNAILAPVLFKTVVEYPLAIVLACYFGIRREAAKDESTARWMDVGAAAGLGIITAGLILLCQRLGMGVERTSLAIMFGIPSLICFFFSRRPLRLALGVALVLTASTMYGRLWTPILTDRSFFGVYRVTEDPKRRFHTFLHGTTIHGVQALDPNVARKPLTYYYPTGPAGQLFQSDLPAVKLPIAAVGLGAGSLASYARPGQPFTFYEIDPMVARIARDPRYFSYLHYSKAKVDIQLGDARLSLERAPDGRFGVIVLDAYSSDAIPIHLMTREAMQLYLRKLAPGGILAFHVSNVHLDLQPVVARLAEDAGLAAIGRVDYEIDNQEQDEWKTASDWVLVARRREDFGALVKDARWGPPTRRPGLRIWTDDYGSALSVLTGR